MKKILVLLSISFLNCAYANNTNIQIQSTALPAGMSQERYDQLFQAHAMNKKSNLENNQSTASPPPQIYAKAKADAAHKARADAAARARARAEAYAANKAEAYATNKAKADPAAKARADAAAKANVEAKTTD